MVFETQGDEVPGYPLGDVLDVRRTTRKRVPAHDPATKKGANPGYPRAGALGRPGDLEEERTRWKFDITSQESGGAK